MDETQSIVGGSFSRQTHLMGSINSSNPIQKLQRTKIQIVKDLGEGGFAKVFLGKILELNQFVAIKQFSVIENKAREEKIIEEVKKELQIVKNLNHPNIVKCFTIHTCNLTGVEGGIQYNLLMEYMDGGSLMKWL
jgi:eukaryotic-like serine/threonine-protein kinase